MHLPGGSMLSMADVLSVFPNNDLLWVVLDFFGMGCAPKGMSMPDFEHKVRSVPEGFRMTWTELKEFGDCVTQAFDCEIAAFRLTDFDAGRPGVELADAKICALDSTEWGVGVDETLLEFRSVLGALQRIAAGSH